MMISGGTTIVVGSGGERMKKLNVDINNDEYRDLSKIAEGLNISVAQLLGAFVQDLTYSLRSAGSDERAMARNWLVRNEYRDW